MQRPDYMKYDGRYPEPPYDEECADSSCTVDSFVGHPERLGEGRAQDLNDHLTRMGQVRPDGDRGPRIARIQPSDGTSGAAVLLGVSNYWIRALCIVTRSIS